MDQKTWRWRKKPSEKTISATDRANITSKENEEVQALVAEKQELEKDLKRLNDKLASTLSESKVKDEQVKKQTNIATEALAGWEKAEAEMLSMKQYLDESIQQQLVYEERVAHFDGALKECMQQLRFVREEQEQRIHNAVTKASKEFEQARMVLEEKISESSERLDKSASECSRLNKSVLAKENLIENLKRQLAQAEADHNELMTKLEYIEKDNASLKYEVRVLEKELSIRNEEREFSHRTADASQKKHLECVKKVVKLESECQRLRLLVRKRLPGPAALAKMKNEVEMLGQDSLGMRRKKLNSTSTIESSSVENSPESTIRRITSLIQRVSAAEEENKTLKETLNRKTNELQFSRSMLARTASKLLQLESHIEESSKSQVTALEQPRSNLAPHEFSLASMSDISSDDKASCAESWASALILELENFRGGKQKGSLSSTSVGNSDINLMDDFIEMEKLAVVSVEKATETCRASLGADKESGPHEINSEVQGKEIVPVPDYMSDFQTCSNSVVPSSGEVNDDETSSIKISKQQPQTSSSKSVGKIVKLIEGISMPAEDFDNSNIHSSENLQMTAGYMVRVFQWKTSELNNILQQFLHACYDLLNGKSDHEKFAAELTAALDWIMNHCFSLQDVSSMRDAVKKQFDWDEVRSENEAEIGTISHFPLTNSECHDLETDEKEEFNNVKDKEINSEPEKEVLESRLQSATEPLMNQLQESEKTIASLRMELQTLTESNGILEDRIQNNALINGDLDVQFTDAELKEAHHKVLALEVEMENKNHYCEELENRCIELQLQLESKTKEWSKDDIMQKDKPVQSDWEITAASEKLAECQETILNLGKQLKALAPPPNDASLFDDAIAAQRNTTTSIITVPPKEDVKAKNRSSLLDHMLGDDDDTTKAMVVHKACDRSSCPTTIPEFIQPLEKILVLNGLKGHDDSSSVNSFAIVRTKKSGGRSLWKKLLGRKKKAKKKAHFPFKT